jgi:hypothetical protein
MYLTSRLQQFDEWNKDFSVDSILVQVCRSSIRSSHETTLVSKQSFEQVSENHGIGDIHHQHLVETQNSMSGSNVSSHDRQRVWKLVLAQSV